MLTTFSTSNVLKNALQQTLKHFPFFLVVSAVLIGAPEFVLLYPPFFAHTGLPGLIGRDLARAVASYLELPLLALAFGIVCKTVADDLSGRRGRALGALAGALSVELWLVFFTLLGTVAIMLGAILLIIPGLILCVRFSVGMPAIVAERVGPLRATERSFDLTQGSAWQIFGLLLLFWIGEYIVTSVGRVLITGDTRPLPRGLPDDVRYLAFLSVDYTLNRIVAAVGMAAIYVELRRLKESPGWTNLADTFT